MGSLKHYSASIASSESAYSFEKPSESQSSSKSQSSGSNSHSKLSKVKDVFKESASARADRLTNESPEDKQRREINKKVNHIGGF